ncbi:UDP-N-acetylmuramoyl-L-alanyl-D-glutamate--2,6-diaminopimelate ligase [Drechslerella dactyloides]|uniref:UDP-N-acetylmuramoyl-L-alanyl-D-glutamate--2,6-diaminopimelate ligase MurE n=1 Tax=Drechslerella dactyloides TaxID=74499 RepID=MURE_DREDA|nr:UDP-N-acetylmuramoyl-L-alanyl-D-glutamate--2,6-diaminopimelate ligase [Drechslerella dactyloides]
MELTTLLAALPDARILQGDPATAITNLAYDPAAITTGGALVCVPPDQDFRARDALRGTHAEQAAAAVSRGAAAIVSEDSTTLDSLPPSVVAVLVPDARRALAVMACEFYGHPSRKLFLVGLTGTNGKTTTAHLTAAILRGSGCRSVGVIGTLGASTESTQFETGCTTPRSLDTQRLLSQYVEAGVDAVVIECSSHGLSLQRVAGCAFDVAVFTNFSQDHLDFHGTMEDYWAAKMLFFTEYARVSLQHKKFTAVVNIDDEGGKKIVRDVVRGYPCVTFGIENADADVRATDVQVSSTNLQFKVTSSDGECAFEVPLTGRFNVCNSLAAVTVATVKGAPLKTLSSALAGVTRPAGRMEFIDEGQEFLIVVDYAHSPASLEHVLNALREFTHTKSKAAEGTGKLICVFGCGGDRDPSKRPQMGAVAAALADVVVITSDNPRSEDPGQIVEGIRVGTTGRGAREGVEVKVEVDRRTAIEYAVGRAGKGDVIVLAGKGHEKYQLLKEGKVHFDDREVAQEALAKLKA